VPKAIAMRWLQEELVAYRPGCSMVTLPVHH